MNKDNAHLYLPLVQALAEGKTIQNNCISDWIDLHEMTFVESAKHYRIKPEPKLGWYRVAELNGAGINETGTVNCEFDEKDLLRKLYFVRWLTGRITYEVTE